MYFKKLSFQRFYGKMHTTQFLFMCFCILFMLKGLRLFGKGFWFFLNGNVNKINYCRVIKVIILTLILHLPSPSEQFNHNRYNSNIYNVSNILFLTVVLQCNYHTLVDHHCARRQNSDI